MFFMQFSIVLVDTYKSTENVFMHVLNPSLTRTKVIQNVGKIVMGYILRTMPFVPSNHLYIDFSRLTFNFWFLVTIKFLFRKILFQKSSILKLSKLLGPFIFHTNQFSLTFTIKVFEVIKIMVLGI